MAGSTGPLLSRTRARGVSVTKLTRPPQAGVISEPGASREMEALGHVRSRACPGLLGPGPDGPLAVNSGVVSAVDRHARAAWALSWARLSCLQKQLVS